MAPLPAIRSRRHLLFTARRCETPLVPAARFAAEVSRIRWTGCDEPRLEQHPLRRDIHLRGCRPDGAYPVMLGCDLTQILDRRSRDSASGNALGDPVSKLSNAIPGEHQVEPAHHRAIVG